MFQHNERFIKICLNLLGDNYLIKSLDGGINNQTYLIKNNIISYVLKKISNEPSPIFDRYLAEKQFLTLTTTTGCANTPKLIEFFDDDRILILEYIQPDNNKNNFYIDDNKIKDCIKFIKEINSNNSLSKKMISQNASESYSDLNGHINNIDSRLLYLNNSHLPIEYRDKASKLLLLLTEKWITLKNESLNFIINNPNQNFIDVSFYILSPSDFGFHNYIINNGNSYFIDFEFSGWDDPAKLYCDFIIQPKFRIPEIFYTELKQNFLNKEYLTYYGERLKVLYKLLYFKWHIIKYSFLNKNKYITNQFNKNNLLTLNLKENFNEIY